MNTPFVTTQLTLLMKLAERKSGESELAWSRFFELYYPAMLKFAELYCEAANAEDVVQRVLVKLVAVMREKRYERRSGTSFRGYLKTLIRNEFLDFYRAEVSRGMLLHDAIEEKELALRNDPGEELDAKWKVAVREAATEHVLARTVLNDAMRNAYRLYVLEGVAPKEVAARLGVSVKYVHLAKSRINERIAAVEAVYGEGK